MHINKYTKKKLSKITVISMMAVHYTDNLIFKLNFYPDK